MIPEGLASRRRRNPRTLAAGLPAVTVRDTRAAGPVADVWQCMVCGSPVARIERRGRKQGGSRVWPCGCTEQAAAGGVLCGQVHVPASRLGELAAWLVWWADHPDPDDGMLWLAEFDRRSGTIQFVAP